MVEETCLQEQKMERSYLQMKRWSRESKVDMEWGCKYLKLALSNVFPPPRPHLLKVLQPFQVAPITGDENSQLCEPMGAFLIQTTTPYLGGWRWGQSDRCETFWKSGVIMSSREVNPGLATSQLDGKGSKIPASKTNLNNYC